MSRELSLDHEKVEDLVSDEVKQIIGQIPLGVISKGYFVFICILLMLFLFSWLIEYSDVLSLPVRVISEKPSRRQIVPSYHDSCFVLMVAKNSGLGKIKRRQVVRLKLGQDFGTKDRYISGRIATISFQSNRNDTILIKVYLPGGLKTADAKVLAVQGFLFGQAEIFVEQKKLLNRLFAN